LLPLLLVVGNGTLLLPLLLVLLPLVPVLAACHRCCSVLSTLVMA